VVDVRGETGLLTYALASQPISLDLPSRRLAASVGESWLKFTLAPIHLEQTCAFTVAGQWRIFTALPEHFVAGKDYG
jgi:hypothetical protein